MQTLKLNRQERWLAGKRPLPDVTSVRTDEHRRYRLASDERLQAEREQASDWLAEWGGALDAIDTDDSLDALVTTALAPLTGQREPWQRPVWMARTPEGERCDIVAVWQTVHAYLTGDPIDDHSEHDGKGQRHAERRLLAALERGSRNIPTGQGWQSTGDITTTNGDTGQTYVALLAEAVEHDARVENRRRNQAADRKRQRAERKAAAAAARAEHAAREAARQAERAIAHDKARFDRDHSVAYGS